MAVTDEYPHVVLMAWLTFSGQFFDIEDWLKECVRGNHQRMPKTINDRTYVRFTFEYEDEATAFALKWL